MSYFGFGEQGTDEARAHNEIRNLDPDETKTEEHKAKFTHELLAGAASYEAAKAYEKHVEQNGKPESHEKAKELLAAFAGAFIDREVETKGLDWIDKKKARRDAENNINGQVTQDNY